VLRSFRVTNHRSIRTEQELALTPVYDKTRPVVPVAAIFGANASGKTNLLDALRFMQHAVRRSHAEWEPGTGIPRMPFTLDPAALEEPSVYVTELVLDGVRHIYGFEIDDKRVREEWLYAYPHNRRRVIFDREGQQIKLGSTLADNRSRGALLAELTRDNSLFLSSAAHFNLADVLPLYQWFRVGVTVVGADHKADQTTLVERLLPTSASRKAVIGLLRAADLGITDVIVDPLHLDLGAPGSPLRFVHSESGAMLKLEDQSDGTLRWMVIVEELLDTLAHGRLLVVDEFNASLHPRLTAHIVDMFHSPDANQRGAQLIFATHESTLLAPFIGDDVVMRDEVWFVDKDRAGATTLYALSGFKPRKYESTERRYLTGAYGAVPRLFPVEFEDAVALSRERTDGRAAS
jgi:uncharacterized protein